MKMGKQEGWHAWGVKKKKKGAFVPNVSDELFKNTSSLEKDFLLILSKVAVCMGYVPSNCPVST